MGHFYILVLSDQDTDIRWCGKILCHEECWCKNWFIFYINVKTFDMLLNLD